MAAVVLLFLISLLDLVEGAENRFVRSGSNLLLEATTTELGKNEFIWKFNTTDNLVKFKHGGNPFIYYEERTVFSTQNYSLLLRNMQHSDTGNYKEIISLGKDKTVAEYTVIVQDPVSPVKLTVTPSDPGCYNFTVTCKTVDSQISGSYQCDNISCHLLPHTHLKVSSLKVYVEESSIICNHSNQVSWEKDVKNISSLCENQPSPNTAAIVGISVGALVLVSILCSVLIIMCKRKRSANTVYEVPQETPQNNQYANPAEITESPSPTSTYALVQLHSRPVQSNVISTSTNLQPETIYAQVDRAAKSNSKPAAVNR
ncbi:SLAM family member 6 [Xiphophorus hellerii]|uniref:SLAM family member 6 n=1 Tax=Xiphophorus hellerii TaxID=8084 RepID=UPI0013B3B738|nr:SLAM family member 6 [Xiphophorus hellerii]